jgi:O-antigen ligase
VLFAGSGVLAQFPRQALDGVMTALLFAAAFFIARSLLRSDDARRQFAICLMVLSAVITFLTAANWITTFVEWWSLTDWTVFPPLNMNLFGGPWGHRHDLTLLIVMLFPSWFLLPAAPIRTALATVIGLLTAVIVVIDGSRTIWLAVAVASGVLLLLLGRRIWPADRRRRLFIGLAAVIALVGLAVSGVLGFLIERAVASESFDMRLTMWRALVDAWIERPIAGYGPGSFPWILQLTDYFDTSSLAPRHPDNAGFQLLGEGGLLGVAGLVVLLVVLVPAIYRGRSRAAMWSLVVFAVASLGQNPTDFGFLVAVGIAWTAFAIPHGALPPDRSVISPSWTRWATVAAFGVVAVAWTSTAVGDVVYGSGRAAIGEGDKGQATALWASATTTDPGMGIYRRQLGAAHLVLGEAESAVGPAQASVTITPSDDLAWRVLALARLAADDPEGARAAIEAALGAQRSDATNLLLLARLQVDVGDPAVMTTLAEIAQAWPEVVSAHGWPGLVPTGNTTQEVVNLALDRWAQGAPSPDPLTDQPVLLAVMAGDLDRAESFALELLGPIMGPASVEVLACQPDARATLEHATEQDRRGALYWTLAERQAALEGDLDERAARLLEIMTGRPRAALWVDHALNPLDENGKGYTADTWGYRRIPVLWSDYALLPDPEAGAARLRVEPREAVRSAGLEAEMPECADSGM